MAEQSSLLRISSGCNQGVCLAAFTSGGFTGEKATCKLIQVSVRIHFPQPWHFATQRLKAALRCWRHRSLLQRLLQHGCFLYQAQKESLSLQGGKGSSHKGFHLIKSGRPIILCSLINPKSTDLGPEAYLHLYHILVARSKSPLLPTTRGRGPHEAKGMKQQQHGSCPRVCPLVHICKLAECT